MDLKVGDTVWYASYNIIGNAWRCVIIHIPENSNYEVEVQVLDFGTDTGPANFITTRPRRRLFTDELDARNAAI